MNNITITADIDVIDFYDKNGQIVTDQYAFIQDDDLFMYKDEEFRVDEYGKIYNLFTSTEKNENENIKENKTEDINQNANMYKNEKENEKQNQHLNENINQNIKINETEYKNEIVVINLTNETLKQDVIENSIDTNLDTVFGRQLLCEQGDDDCDEDEENCMKNSSISNGENMLMNIINHDIDKDKSEDKSDATFLLKFVLVIYCAGFHCATFTIFQTVTQPSVSSHCILAFLYYFCLFFVDLLWQV